MACPTIQTGSGSLFALYYGHCSQSAGEVLQPPFRRPKRCWRVRVSLRTCMLPGYGQCRERTESEAWLIGHLINGQVERWEPLCQGREDLLSLQTCQGCPKAVM